MEGRITFYTYGSSIELNGKLFAAGELTTDLLNLSAERYQPMHQQFEQIKSWPWNICGHRSALSGGN